MILSVYNTCSLDMDCDRIDLVVKHLLERDVVGRPLYGRVRLRHMRESAAYNPLQQRLIEQLLFLKHWKMTAFLEQIVGEIWQSIPTLI